MIRVISLGWGVQSFTLAAMTVSDAKKAVREWLTNGRIVQMTPRALARFQTFPDGYVLPSNKKLACYGIGNAVPPLLAKQVIESL